MAHASQSPQLVRSILVGAALLLAMGALGVTATGNTVAFTDVASIQLIMVIIAWAVLAAATRWLVVGKAEETIANSRSLLIWGGFKVCLFLAVVILLLGWAIALALGHAFQQPLLQAIVLLVVVSAATGIIGGATINSWLAVRHLLHRRSS